MLLYKIQQNSDSKTGNRDKPSVYAQKSRVSDKVVSVVMLFLKLSKNEHNNLMEHNNLIINQNNLTHVVSVVSSSLFLRSIKKVIYLSTEMIH